MEERDSFFLSRWVRLAKSIKGYESEIDLLSLAGGARDERIYSKTLFSLLSLKKEILVRDSFMKLISDSLGLKYSFSSCFDITREAKVPYGFIDLLIVTSDNKAIIIENKIDAGDQEKQISRYYGFLEKDYDTYVVYLTPFGHEPSEFSISAIELDRLKKQKRFTCLSYNKDILSWLDCLFDAVNNQNTKSVIVQFYTTIKGMLKMNNDITMLANNEFGNVSYSDIENLSKARDALDVLIYAKRAIHFFQEFVNNYLNSEKTSIDMSRVLYVCGMSTYKNYDEWEKAICENGFAFYGIVYSYGLDLKEERPMYGLRLTTEGNAPSYTNRAFFGVYIGKEKSNPKNLKLKSYKWDDEGKYGHWGQQVEITSYIFKNDYDGVAKLFFDTVDYIKTTENIE